MILSFLFIIFYFLQFQLILLIFCVNHVWSGIIQDLFSGGGQMGQMGQMGGQQMMLQTPKIALGLRKIFLPIPIPTISISKDMMMIQKPMATVVPGNETPMQQAMQTGMIGLGSIFGKGMMSSPMMGGGMGGGGMTGGGMMGGGMMGSGMGMMGGGMGMHGMDYGGHSDYGDWRRR